MLFLRLLMCRISAAYYDTLGIINADRIFLDLVQRRDSAREATDRCYTAMCRLESKGQKGGDSWHVENALQQIHLTEVSNMNGAIILMREHLDQERSLTLKVVRWVRDWF